MVRHAGLLGKHKSWSGTSKRKGKTWDLVVFFHRKKWAGQKGPGLASWNNLCELWGGELSSAVWGLGGD